MILFGDPGDEQPARDPLRPVAGTVIEGLEAEIERLRGLLVRVTRALGDALTEFECMDQTRSHYASEEIVHECRAAYEAAKIGGEG